MSRRQLRPAVSACAARLAEQLRAVQSVSASAPCESEIALLDRLCVLREEIAKRTDALEAALSEAEGAEQVRDLLIPAMLRLREACDAAEPLVDAEQWPIPTYSDLLFGV